MRHQLHVSLACCLTHTLRCTLMQSIHHFTHPPTASFLSRPFSSPPLPLNIPREAARKRRRGDSQQPSCQVGVRVVARANANRKKSIKKGLVVFCGWITWAVGIPPSCFLVNKGSWMTYLFCFLCFITGDKPLTLPKTNRQIGESVMGGRVPSKC